ncbi:MAG: GxxExxY protein [Pirellulales bacterium]|nr:GxxExxY protein [Pirellulales bacterium]
MTENPDAHEELVHSVIGAMIEVHRELGPGYVEKVYQRALEIELAERGIEFESQKRVRLRYKNKPVGVHKFDLFVAGQIVVELKSVEELHKRHYAQVRSYLKAVKKSVGLLANFSEFPLDFRRVELKQ